MSTPRRASWRAVPRAVVMLAATPRSCASPRGILFDFTKPTGSIGWSAVDDRIMGGTSTSRLEYNAAGCDTRFVGELVVEGGGFASVRYQPAFSLEGDVRLTAARTSLRGRELPIPIQIGLSP